MARFFAVLAAAAIMMQGALAMPKYPHYYPMPNATVPEVPYPTGTSYPTGAVPVPLKERTLREVPINLGRP